MSNKLIVKENPSFSEFYEILQYGLRRKHVVFFVCLCEVYYEGRSRSYLELGERMVFIKEDRSILIHRAKGYKPVNWQPSGSEIRIKKTDESIILICIRVNPKEKITIIIREIYLVMVAKLTDSGRFHMHFTEEEMKIVIYNNISSIIEEGMRGITMEKEIKSGKIDIFARDREGNYVIIELKKGRATERDVLQLNRYVSELRETNPKIRGILVSPSIDLKAFEMIKHLDLEYKKVTFKDILTYM